ncbi:MAG: outer membrane beta-barrel protein [Acidobacteriaceae bacterium]
MKRIVLFFGLGLFFMMPSWLMAQQDVPPPPPPQPSQSQYNPPPQHYDPPANSAYFRNHGEIGVYADYLNFKAGSYNSNYVGVGGRVGFNVNPNIALEAEMNYDFARNFTSTYTNGANTTFVKTRIRPLTGLFGPKFQLGRSSAFRAFLEGKVGFIDFSTTNTPNVVSGGTFSSAIDQIGGGGTHLAVFPGGGIEAFLGPIGLRLDVGDEIYVANGAKNNLRVTFGPTIRF